MASAFSDPRAILAHDTFNVVVLSIIGPLNLWYLYQTTDLSALGTPQLGAGHNDLAQGVLYFFLAYLVIDTVWIWSVPSCVVTKPIYIIAHHVVTLLLVLFPLWDQRFSWHGMADLVSETNTLFLTIRRHSSPGTLRYNVFTFIFYAAWFATRLFLFPALAVFFLHEYLRLSKELGTYFNAIVIAPILQLFLVAVSLYWTYLIVIKFRFTHPPLADEEKREKREKGAAEKAKALPGRRGKAK